MSAVDRVARVWRLSPLLLALVLAAGTTSGVAAATPLQDAQAQAAALRGDLDRLQAQADRAVEDYDRAAGELAGAVSASISADQALAAAVQTAKSDQRALNGRVRALYKSGGPAAFYASALSAGSLADMADQAHIARHVVGSDSAALGRDQKQAVVVDATRGQARAAAAERTRLEREADRRAGDVERLISQQQSALDAADERVRVLAVEQQRAAELRAQEEFAAQLAQARRFVPDAVSTGLPPPLAASGTIEAVLRSARAQLGKPYVWGAVGPNSFDCSGVSGFAYAAAGIRMPRTAAQQWLTGPHPGLAGLLPGDLLFWGPNPRDYTSIDHMAIYLGANQMIVAPRTGDVVKVEAVYSTNYFGATRVDPAVSGNVPGPQWAPG